MLIKAVKKLSPKERLIYWIRERESIRLNRLRGETMPWTSDEILSEYRFCNVHRMDDKVSQWLLKNWYVPYLNHPNMLVAVTMARHFNLPSILKAIGFPTIWSPKDIESNINAYKREGAKVFNGAYIVSPGNRLDKVKRVLYDICDRVDGSVVNTDTMEGCVHDLMQFEGIGSFMAGQIAADLRYAVGGRFADKGTWAAYGPGSLRGLNRFYGRPPTDPMSRKLWVKEFTTYLEYCQTKLPPTICDRIEAIDYQNCLCEFDKYERALWGEGKPKQLYRPGV